MTKSTARRIVIHETVSHETIDAQSRGFASLQVMQAAKAAAETSPKAKHVNLFGRVGCYNKTSGTCLPWFLNSCMRLGPLQRTARVQDLTASLPMSQKPSVREISKYPGSWSEKDAESLDGCR